MASQQTPTTGDLVSEPSKDDVDPVKLEALVTAEQVHSANVARKRRNISKRRPNTAGVKPRDPTPVRTSFTDRETTDEEEATVVGSVPNAPERKQRRKSRAEDKEIISKEEKNEQNVKCLSENNNNGGHSGSSGGSSQDVQENKAKKIDDRNTAETENAENKSENVPQIEDKPKEIGSAEVKPEAQLNTEAEVEKPSIDVELKEKVEELKKEKPVVPKEPPRVKPARKHKENVIKTKVENIDPHDECDEEVIIVKKALKGVPQSEVFALLKQAKRQNVNKAKARLKKSEMAKRSLSSPREKTNGGEDLVESFKKAQLQAMQKQLNIDPTTSEEEEHKAPAHVSRRTGAKLRVIELRKDEDTPSEMSTTEDTNVLVHRAAKLTPKAGSPKEAQQVEKELQKRKRFFMSLRDLWREWKLFKHERTDEYKLILRCLSKCIAELLVIMIFCGLGGIMFKFTEGTFENFYKCGVKRVKRDFIDTLWMSSHSLQEERWKSLARGKLRIFEDELHTAHEAGMTSYSGQRSWSFLNGVVYALTVVTTIGYGHMYPTTRTGQALTIVYAIIGIPLFLICLTDFGKLFTRCIKFVWAFVRRVYYTGSCKKVRRTVPVQDFFKGAQMMYDIATFRRPSTWDPNSMENGQQPTPNHLPTSRPPTVEGSNTPTTPAPSNFAIDDEFNLPISVAILILVLYIFSGACIYYMWEQWDFFASFYFVFISMSTIGFGDYVPKHPICMIVSIVYLVFGLALMSMCINVVQVKLSDTFRQASAKIGATIGLSVAEEDGSITPIPPAPVEIVEVHTNSNSK